MDPPIDIGTRWKYVVNTTPKLLKRFLPDKPRYPLNGMRVIGEATLNVSKNRTIA